MVISRMEGFDWKSQGGNSLELTTRLEWAAVSITETMGIHGVEASNLDGGWGYRGYEGAQARLGVEVPFGDTPADGRSATGSQAGWGAGGGGFFSRYRDTDLLFFYPSIYTFLFLDYFTSPRLRIRYTVPFEWYFRKDLAASFSLGISIGVVYTWTRPRGGQR
ncbi:MAG: hypothetical protein Kow009_04490 [Spirochaetales bacterium]